MPDGMMILGLNEKPPSPLHGNHPPFYTSTRVIVEDGLPETVLLARYLPLTYRHDSQFEIVPIPSRLSGRANGGWVGARKDG